MVLVDNDTHSHYCRDDLHCMNLLRHPVWVFDIDTMSMYWANFAALKVWNASSLEELLERDYKSDMSEASASWLNNFQRNELQQNTFATERWTFYPKGMKTAQQLDCSFSAIRIQNSDSTSNSCSSSASNLATATKIAMLVEVELSDNQTKITDSSSRSIEILKHLPVAVSQYTLDGSQLMYQNPKASQTFGNYSGNEDNDDDIKNRASNTENNSVKNSINKNALLRQFVDVEIGEKALLAIQNDEIFSAETKLYIQSPDATKDGNGDGTAATEGDGTGTEAGTASDRITGRRRIIGNGSSNRINIANDSITHRKSEADQNSPPEMQERWFHVLLRKTRDPVTSDFVILYIARDISDIVKARKDSVRAAMKSEFLDVMAHEIRTPLHQIIGCMDMLESDAQQESNTEHLNSIQQIQSSCSLLMAIINDLLDCSKLENGQLQIEYVNFTLQTLIDSCMAAIGPQCHTKNIIVHCSIDPICPMHAISDPNRLRQILHNLLSNAIKFTPISNGSITITVKPVQFDFDEDDTDKENVCNNFSVDRQRLRFEVTDNGIGIAPSEQHIVFERYRQANASVARNFGGTGLGLPICKGLVELLGGTIGLRSEIGKGTAVYFDIPFRVAPAPAPAPADMCGTHSSNNVCHCPSDDSTRLSLVKPSAMNVLVVEDNIVNQKVVRAMLQRMGHKVTVAENGQVALNVIHQQQFQVVLMDIQMPVMDGIECTKHIRNVLHYTKEQLPILGLTAAYQHSDRDYYVNDVGMNGCLGKPLPMEKLRQAMICHGNKI